MTDNTPPPPAPPPPDNSGSPPEQAVSIARIEQLLNQGGITKLQGAMLWGSNYAALVTVRDQELQTTAVYKPQRGERPLWDFPDGTLCYREAAAYFVSKALGWFLVPPTALRHGPHGLGSLQLYIEHDPEINYFSLDNRFITQLQRFAVFDYLVNNTDRKGGHLLLDTQRKLWGIDHGLTFHTLPKLRTVIWEFSGQPVPDEIQCDIQKLCEQLDNTTTELFCKLVDILSQAEISALRRRAQHLLEKKRFPNPGPGPNHPWPPV